MCDFLMILRLLNSKMAISLIFFFYGRLLTHSVQRTVFKNVSGKEVTELISVYFPTIVSMNKDQYSDETTLRSRPH